MGANGFLILVDGTADAAFAVDSNGRISAWNSAAAELFGLSEREAINVRCHEILKCSTDDQIFSFDQCVLTQAAQDNRPVANFDLRVQTKTGKQWCNFSKLIATDPATGARQTLYIARPREMRKRLEQALREFVRLYSRNGSNGAVEIPSSIPAAINVHLTAREIEVLKSLAKGQSTRAIANQLNISSATVNNHIKHILTKLDVHTRLEAIRHAERAGVI